MAILKKQIRHKLTHKKKQEKVNSKKEISNLKVIVQKLANKEKTQEPQKRCQVDNSDEIEQIF